jgi:hypothetical protein
MARNEHKKSSLLYLFIMLVALVILFPVLKGSRTEAVILNSTFTFVLIAIMYGIRGKRGIIYIGIMIGVPWLAVVWVNLRLDSVVLRVVSALLMTLLFSYTLGILVRHIIEAKEISADLLFAAGCFYMLIGFAWSGICITIELIKPRSFLQITAGGYRPVEHSADLMYYSFITLTTLGYGDITPQSPLTRSFAILEAITGVLFMGILIGTIVGIFVAHRTRMRYRD